MKNIKLVAKIMLLVILATSALTLTACNGWYGMVDRTITFKNHKELCEFAKKYGSENDGFVETFISFDFDNNNDVEVYQYNFYTTRQIKKSIITGDIINNDWYDKDHSSGFECEYIFHMNAIDAQIICHYSTNSDYNFYQGDEISFQLVDTYQKFEPNGDKEEWADKRTFNMETLDYDKYYEYMYVYQININGNEEVNLNITAKNEMSIEELDKIVQLFIDNIVIINTEG